MICKITAKCRNCYPRPCLEAPEEDYKPGELEWMNGVDPAKRERIAKVCKCGREFTHAWNLPSDTCKICRRNFAQQAYRKRHGTYKAIGKSWDHIDPVKVQSLITAKGITYTAVERTIGVGHGAVAKWINEGQGISRENMAKLALCLKVKVEDIVTQKEVA